MNLLELLGPGVHPAFTCAPAAPEFFRPRVGRRTRVFLSASDRDAYEVGFGDYPRSPNPAYAWGGPYGSGWSDCEWEQEAKDDAKREAFERDNEWGDK